MSKIGFVLAVTGQSSDMIFNMACKTAMGLKACMPDIPVHLFSSEEIAHPSIDKVHALENPNTRRPKIEALIRSEFDRTVYLDNDIHAMSDFSEIFETLRSFDFAIHPNGLANTLDSPKSFWGKSPYATYNSGVFGVSRSQHAMEILNQWRDRFEAKKWSVDQPVLNALLHRDYPSKVANLPKTHNFMVRKTPTRERLYLPMYSPLLSPPKVFHLSGITLIKDLHATLRDRSKPFEFGHKLTQESRLRFNLYKDLKAKSAGKRREELETYLKYWPRPVRKMYIHHITRVFP
ncbi:MAG: putative nucleotide-diphospho-sugar transferase [Pseudomonadota bacterium]